MHLVVQHPELSAARLAALAARIGRPPSVQVRGAARWDDVALGAAGTDALARDCGVDAALVPAARRMSDFRLIAFDMDSTLITIECVDEIADFAGRKAQVAAITEAAMRGEITDYRHSLRERVALLQGLQESVLQRVWDERVRLTPGVPALVHAAKASGLKILLVSGGFTFFTGRLREQLGLDFTNANVLEVQDGRLTGRLIGNIVDATVKRETVLAACAQLGCGPSSAIVVGDGANDLEMMKVAGVSVAYRAKPAVRAQATHAVDHCGLDAIIGLFADAPQWQSAGATHLRAMRAA